VSFSDRLAISSKNRLPRKALFRITAGYAV
jgi:hypothetical protein